MEAQDGGHSDKQRDTKQAHAGAWQRGNTGSQRGLQPVSEILAGLMAALMRDHQDQHDKRADSDGNANAHPRQRTHSGVNVQAGRE